MSHSEELAAHCRKFLLLVVAGTLLPATPACAQVSGSTADPASRVLTGKLANGLAYHIEKTGKVGTPLSFSLIVRVGHRNDAPEQQVAHVLEHIVLARTSNVPVNGTVWDRVSKLRGRVNAGTAESNTVFYLDLPSSDPSAVAEAFNILTDWARPGDLSNDEIDRERKTVIEEFRRGGSEEARRLERERLRVVLPGDPLLRIAPDPLGTLSASAATIRSMHHRYYVPSNMVIVIVGDIDPQTMLGQLASRIEHFPSGAIMSANIDRQPSPVRGGHYVAQSHTEGPDAYLNITYKISTAPCNSWSRAKENAIFRVVEQLINQALTGFAERRETALIGSFSILPPSDHMRASGVRIYQFRFPLNRHDARDGLFDALLLLESLKKRGFSPSKVRRNQSMVADMTQPTQSTEDIANRWRSFYAYGVSEPSERAVRDAINKLSARDINDAVKSLLNPANRDIFLVYPKAEVGQVPDNDELETIVMRVAQATPVEYSPPPLRTPSFTDIALKSSKLPAGITEGFGYLRWKLPESGATLLVKRTTSPTVRLVVRRPGGAVRFAQAAMSAQAAAAVVNNSGLGGLSGFELDRYLKDQGLAVSASVLQQREQVTASGPAKLWPQILGLARAQIVRPQCREDAFQDYVDRETKLLGIGGSVGDDDGLSRAIDAATGNKWRLEGSDLDSLKFDDVCRQYREMFGDTAGMTIVVEGDISEKAVLDGVVSALDIPGKSARESFIPKPAEETIGQRTVLEPTGGASAKVALILIAKGGASEARLVSDALKGRIFNRLRVVEKGTYAPRGGISEATAPSRTILSVEFECAPENIERLIMAAREEIDKLGKDGPTDGELSSARERLRESVLDADTAAEIWISEGALARRGLPTDDETRGWSRQFLQSSRLHEFVQMPKGS